MRPYLAGWIDVTWDAGGSNSYRMGAENKFDLTLAPSHDPEKLQVAAAAGTARPSETQPSLPAPLKGREGASGRRSRLHQELQSRKSSSTPSLNQVKQNKKSIFEEISV